MASEIQYTFKVAASKLNTSVTNLVSTKTQDMNGDHMIHNVQAIGTSEEAVQLGDVDISNASGGEYSLQIVNKDSTNNVEVKVKIAAVPTYWLIDTLHPGEAYHAQRMPKLDGSSLGGVYLKALVAACNCEVISCEVKN